MCWSIEYNYNSDPWYKCLLEIKNPKQCIYVTSAGSCWKNTNYNFWLITFCIIIIAINIFKYRQNIIPQQFQWLYKEVIVLFATFWRCVCCCWYIYIIRDIIYYKCETEKMWKQSFFWLPLWAFLASNVNCLGGVVVTMQHVRFRGGGGGHWRFSRAI